MATQPIHQWTHDGAEVLIVRFCEADGLSSYGFKYPLTPGTTVEAPDWDPKPNCGNGLHGWPWGMNIGDGKDPEWNKTWMVIGANPEDVIDLGGKVKFRRGTVRLVGQWYEAGNHVLNGQMAWVHARTKGTPERAENEMGSASATGGSSSASATGGRGSASATGGSSSASATGERGSASATGGSSSASATGWRGSASATGEMGSASATGEMGSASATGGRGSASATGDCSAAVCTNLDGRVRGGKYSALALAWHNPKANRLEMRVGIIGRGDGKDKKLKSDTWYRLNARGQFVVEG